MKLEMFFEKFELFAEAPNAVARMRETILHFAVQGQLVPQNPNDEPAIELVQRVAATKANLVQTKIIKSESLLDAIAEVEILFPTPDSWTWLRAGELCYPISSGSTPDQSVFHLSEGVPYLKVYNIRNQFVDFDYKRQFIDTTYHEQKMKRSKLIPGDVIMNIVGPPLGKVAIVPETFPEWNCNQAIAFFRPIFPEFSPYLYLFLKEGTFLQNIQLIGTAGQDNISVTKCKFLPVPIPPLAEQKRIVAKVDELMALCDHLENQQKNLQTQHTHLARASLSRFAETPTPENLEFLFHTSYDVSPADLRKSILALAVQGKLVAQDSDDETGSDSLSRLGLSSTDTTFSDFETGNEMLPSSWTRVRFEDIAIIAGGVTLGRKLGDRKTITLPYLRVANVKRGEIDLTIVKEVEIAETEIERYALRENDILMTEGGDWDKVGRAAIWKAQIPICLHQNHIFRARMRSPEITPYWFERYFNSSIGRSYFESASKQTTNLASINMRQVRNCPIPFPPLAEQRRIVTKVNELMALVDQLETQLTTARHTASNLLDALVAELTQQHQTAPAAPRPNAPHKPNLEQPSLFEA
jgi:type I restriction enzyme, S subunit